jgi:hypothetical protein
MIASKFDMMFIIAVRGRERKRSRSAASNYDQKKQNHAVRMGGFLIGVVCVNCKYDWAKLKTKYLAGDYKDLKEFAEKEGIPHIRVRQKGVGWNDEKRTRIELKQNKILEKTAEKQIETEAQINERHYKIWGKFLDYVDRRVQSGEITDNAAKNLAEVFDKAHKGQRLAMGLSDSKTDVNMSGSMNIGPYKELTTEELRKLANRVDEVLNAPVED